jgi:hypothetical protein
VPPGGNGGRAAAAVPGTVAVCASLFAMTPWKKAAIFVAASLFSSGFDGTLLHMNRFAAGVQRSMHAHFLSFVLFHLILMVDIVAFS